MWPMEPQASWKGYRAAGLRDSVLSQGYLPIIKVGNGQWGSQRRPVSDYGHSLALSQHPLSSFMKIFQVRSVTAGLCHNSLAGENKSNPLLLGLGCGRRLMSQFSSSPACSFVLRWRSELCPSLFHHVPGSFTYIYFCNHFKDNNQIWEIKH